MFTKENILDEINKDLKKAYNGELFKCRLILFQFFQIKEQQEYVGYIMHKSKNNEGKYQYTLDISEIGTLNNANILTEVKKINIDDYFFKLLLQFYSEQTLKIKFTSILDSQNIAYEDKNTLYELFLSIKEHNEDIFRNREYFSFRFFKLSDKYAPSKNILYEALLPEFSWRLNYKIKRGI